MLMMMVMMKLIQITTFANLLKQESQVQNPKSKSRIQIAKSVSEFPDILLCFSCLQVELEFQLVFPEKPESKISKSNPKCKITNPKFKNSNSKSKAPNQNSKTLNPKSEIQDPNPNPKIQNCSQQTQYPKYKIRIQN